MTAFHLEHPKPQGPITQASFQEWDLPDGTAWTRFHRVADAYLLRFPGLADFEVADEGNEIRCWPAPGISDVTVEHLYLNQVLPLALSKQGKLVFHASAIEVRDGAVAFMGESGRGKSTLAASFAAAGSRFLTDDALLLEKQGDAYRVLPSHASIRLWGDSQQMLVGDDAAVAPPVQYTPKARILSGQKLAFCPDPRLLRGIYFLGDGSADRIDIQPVRPAEALMELVKHSFLLDIEARDLLAAHFDELSAIANLPLFFRLDYPRRYEDLPEVRRAIIEHATRETRPA